MDRNLAPIILFVYNRPLHTEQTLEALMANDLANESTLYIYVDGAKADANEITLKAVKDTKAVIRKKKWCKVVNIVEREINLGLAENVISGVTEIVNQHGRIIVLEDDLVTSPYFLQYCNDGLNVYEDEKNVYSINGYQFDLGIKTIDTFLIPLGGTCWGWATWKDRWSAFEIDPKFKNVMQQNRYLTQRFNLADYDYTSMLNNKKSWAIRWYYSVFIRNGLGLFPTQSLVKNCGFDGTGVHFTSDVSNTVVQNLVDCKIEVFKKHQIDFTYFDLLLNYFTNPKSVKNPSLFQLLKQDIRKYSRLIFPLK